MAPRCLLRGMCILGVLIGGTEFEGSFVVSDGLVVDAIVGLDFIQRHNCVIDSGKKLLRFPAVNLSVGLHGIRAAADKNTTKNMESVGLVTMQKILVPPESEMELMVKAAGNVTEGVWMVENNSASIHGVMVARAVACPKDGLILIRVINPRHCSIHLKKGVELAKMELIEQDCISTVSASGKRKIEGVSSVDQESLWSLASKAGKHLNPQEKEQLFLLLLESRVEA